MGKYIDVIDSYKSINESLIHAGIAHKASIKVKYIDASDFLSSDPKDVLSDVSGVIIPGGFGNRGIEGKIEAIKYCRENKLPLLGICLGMQLAAIEFARNVVGIKDAASEEFEENSESKIIHLMDEQKDVENLGGTMRLRRLPLYYQRRFKGKCGLSG